MDALLLRLDAPLMSFGGVVVDAIGVTAALPGRSMLTGLLGNALGYRHGENRRLQALQQRIGYAVRCDRPGREIVDFQTVDLGQPFLREGWTTRGKVEGREGGSSTGTHIRYRHFLADAIYTVALNLSPASDEPTLATLATALGQPARPLFVGRKPCIPSSRVSMGLVSGNDLRSILQSVPAVGGGRGVAPPWRAWWPATDETPVVGARRIAVYDDRDWTNQIHTGRRWLIEGVIDE